MLMSGRIAARETISRSTGTGHFADRVVSHRNYFESPLERMVSDPISTKTTQPILSQIRRRHLTCWTSLKHITNNARRLHYCYIPAWLATTPNEDEEPVSLERNQGRNHNTVKIQGMSIEILSHDGHDQVSGTNHHFQKDPMQTEMSIAPNAHVPL